MPEKESERRPSPLAPKTTSADVVAAFSRAGASLVPWIGPLVAEVLVSWIPNQRIDRLQAFAEGIADRVSRIDRELVELRFSDPRTAELLEDCMMGSAGSLSAERIEYYANLFVNGISAEDMSHERNRKMASLLAQLSDAEIVMLRGFQANPGFFLNVSNAQYGVEDNDEDGVLRSAWKQRLKQLGLIEQGRVIRSGNDYIGLAYEEPRRWPDQISPLGEMLLAHIAPIESNG